MLSETEFRTRVFLGLKILAILLFSTVLAFRVLEVVPPGHVAVQVTFGKIGGQLDPGLNFVNPASSWVLFNCKNQSIDVPQVPMPSADQMTTKIDWSVQYRANCEAARTTYGETGNLGSAINTHLKPHFRNLLREHGKGVDRAEDFYSEAVQSQLQQRVLSDLQEQIRDKGILVSDVLLRNITLPAVITQAIEAKKKRVQEAEAQKAELERFRVEQEQKVATAEAEKQAALLEVDTARARARANDLLRRSLTAELVRMREIEVREQAVAKWNGILPQVTGGGSPIIELSDG